MDECIAACCGMFSICCVTSSSAWCNTRTYGSGGCCGSRAGCCNSCCGESDDPFSDEAIARETDREQQEQQEKELQETTSNARQAPNGSNGYSTTDDGPPQLPQIQTEQPQAGLGMGFPQSATTTTAAT
ncbi:hypothetical protein D9611_009292 [Ephemerocybe angulata]|uniref:Uncharacterized protein n=1 Tax=Ephemerocybe angulata TaxID=980116 RepID=A0A8H5BGN6_9AGAR|nr:hypothetical protein D9611_009292 [Tulosesus angulatus]